MRFPCQGRSGKRLASSLPELVTTKPPHMRLVMQQLPPFGQPVRIPAQGFRDRLVPESANLAFTVTVPRHIHVAGPVPEHGQYGYGPVVAQIRYPDMAEGRQKAANSP